ncbi:MAG: hypothetical protein LBI31_01025 [Zoogloeaceae bacterium]|jgi:hypothetical protein|nr:hypothetical protein [Zoogloeaceae bacterium]
MDTQKEIVKKEQMEAIPFYGAFVSYKKGLCAWYELLIIYAILVLSLIKCLFFPEFSETVLVESYILGFSVLSAMTFGCSDSDVPSDVEYLVHVKRIGSAVFIFIPALMVVVMYTSRCISYNERLVLGGIVVLTVVFCISRFIREIRQLKTYELKSQHKTHVRKAAFVGLFLLVYFSYHIFSFHFPRNELSPEVLDKICKNQ